MLLDSIGVNYTLLPSGTVNDRSSVRIAMHTPANESGISRL